MNRIVDEWFSNLRPLENDGSFSFAPGDMVRAWRAENSIGLVLSIRRVASNMAEGIFQHRAHVLWTFVDLSDAEYVRMKLYNILNPKKYLGFSC
jgi:hypothetical protein